MLEVIVTTLEEALLAEQGGAGRLELVANLAAGGLTPDLGLVQRVIAAVRIPVNVMIRPHARGFHYREEELRTMLEGIRAVREGGPAGSCWGRWMRSAGCTCDTSKSSSPVPKAWR